MKRLCATLLLLSGLYGSASALCIAGMGSCDPDVSTVQQQIAHAVSTISQGKETLVSASKTDGRDTGMGVYEVLYNAVVELNEDVLYCTTCFGVLGAKGCGGGGSVPGWQCGTKGQRVTIPASVLFRKHESGWVLTCSQQYVIPGTATCAF